MLLIMVGFVGFSLKVVLLGLVLVTMYVVETMSDFVSMCF